MISRRCFLAASAVVVASRPLVAFAEKMKHREPHVFIRPETSGVRLLHFHKAEQIFNQSESAAKELKAALREHLSGKPGS